jgi:hypothetical protein
MSWKKCIKARAFIGYLTPPPAYLLIPLLLTALAMQEGMRINQEL